VLHFYEVGGPYTVTLDASNACSQTSLSQSLTIFPVMQLYLPVVNKEP
jgi:hypothetical protein